MYRVSLVLESKCNQLFLDLAHDPETNGILMQMPLPRQLNERDLCNIIPTEKDVDGLNAASIGKNVKNLIKCD